MTSFTLAAALQGNGFIAAFVAGLAYGAALDREHTDLERSAELPELGGELLGLVVWFLFGAALVPLALASLDGAMVLYAVLSLTVVRMVPVALCLVRSGLDRTTVLFLAWFGPRGLASVVFAVLAVEELGEGSALTDRAIGAIVLTVLGSVVLHGVSAGPGPPPGPRSVSSSSRPSATRWPAHIAQHDPSRSPGAGRGARIDVTRMPGVARRVPVSLGVTVVLAAHRDDHPHHGSVRPWLDHLLAADRPFTVPDTVWASFPR